MIDIGLDGIKDTGIRDNFVNILEEFNKPIHKFNFQFFELNFTAAVTNYRYRHNLPYTPKDVIITAQYGTGVAEFNYQLFSSTHIDITTTDACTVRFLLGNFSKDSAT